MYPEGYRRGCNGAASKAAWHIKCHVGSNPTPSAKFICVAGEKNIVSNVRGKRVCIIADIITSARDGLLVRIQRNAPTRWAEHPRYLKIRPKGFKRSANG